MSDRPLVLYAAIYSDIADAELDYEAVFALHDAGLIGRFDSAVIRKEDDGKVREKANARADKLIEKELKAGGDELEREIAAAAHDGTPT